MAPASTSGTSSAAKPGGATSGAGSGGGGTTIGAADVGGGGCGGRWNGAVHAPGRGAPPRACGGGVGTARSSGAAPISSTVAPTRIRVGDGGTVASEMGRPATHVPLREPRSRRIAPPIAPPIAPLASRSSRCRREIVGSSSSSSVAVRGSPAAVAAPYRPTVRPPDPNLARAPASGPLTTRTSSSPGASGPPSVGTSLGGSKWAAAPAPSADRASTRVTVAPRRTTQSRSGRSAVAGTPSHAQLHAPGAGAPVPRPASSTRRSAAIRAKATARSATVASGLASTTATGTDHPSETKRNAMSERVPARVRHHTCLSGLAGIDTIGRPEGIVRTLGTCQHQPHRPLARVSCTCSCTRVRTPIERP